MSAMSAIFGESARVDRDVERAAYFGAGGLAVDAIASTGAGVPGGEIAVDAWHTTEESVVIGAGVGWIGGRFTKFPIAVLRGLGAGGAVIGKAIAEADSFPTSTGQGIVYAGKIVLAAAIGYGSSTGVTEKK